jgi:nucleoid-associated protein YgaU
MKSAPILLLSLTLTSCLAIKSDVDKAQVQNTKKFNNSEDIVITLDEEFDKEVKNYRSLSSVEVGNIYQDEEKIEDVNSVLNENSNFYIQRPKKYTYTVQKNDTLTIIAFKLYGDISKWKDLAIKNGMDEKSTELSPGDSLAYDIPENPYVWKPMGKPYVIKKGDTLQKISLMHYQTNHEWPYIWKNNRPFIKNPNLIYTGFTVYYLPIDKKQIFEKVLKDRHLFIEKHSKNPEKLNPISKL